MAGGWFHTLLLRSDGQASAFGRDDQGSFKFEVLSPADGNSYVEAACGLYHSVLLCENGVAVACGSNSIGQCDVPALPPGVSYIQAAASEHHTALLRSDGLAEVFGNNFWGQCSVPALDNKTSYTGISVGLRHTVLLRNDGQAVAIGQKDGGCCDIPLLPPGLRYKAVAAGGGHTVLLRSDGRALALGRNNCGQTEVPALPEGLRYVSVAAGGTHTVLLRSDGQVATCGANACGQCDVPPLPEGMAYVHIAAGYRHTLLLRSDGGAAACGWNLDGQCNIPPLEAGVRYVPPKSAASQLLDDWDMPAANPRQQQSVDEANLPANMAGVDPYAGDPHQGAAKFKKGHHGGSNGRDYYDLGEQQDHPRERPPSLYWNKMDLPGYRKETPAMARRDTDEDGSTRSTITCQGASTRAPSECIKLSGTPDSSLTGLLQSSQARRRSSTWSSVTEQTPPPAHQARAETGARQRSLSRESSVKAYPPRRGSGETPMRSARSSSRERLGPGAAVRAHSREAPGGSGYIIWTGQNHGKAFTSRKKEEEVPHDQLQEYGGRVHDLREITRPNLQYGACVLKTNAPEEQPHDFLEEYGGHVNDLSDIMRPGLQIGGTFMGSSVPKEQKHDFLEEYGGLVRNLGDLTRPNLQYGTCVFKTNEPAALPHDQLREYGGRIHDLREVTRPNLQYGTCVFKTHVPEALPHDQLREYGGHIQDLSQITRPGLSHGGMVPVEVKVDQLPSLRSSPSWYAGLPSQLKLQEDAARAIAQRAARPQSAPRLGRPKSPSAGRSKSPGRKSPRKADASKAGNMKWLERYKVVEEAIKGHIANWHKTTKTHPALDEGEDEMDERTHHRDAAPMPPQAVAH